MTKKGDRLTFMSTEYLALCSDSYFKVNTNRRAVASQNVTFLFFGFTDRDTLSCRYMNGSSMIPDGHSQDRVCSLFLLITAYKPVRGNYEQFRSFDNNP